MINSIRTTKAIPQLMLVDLHKGHIPSFHNFEENVEFVWEKAKEYNSFIAVRNLEYLRTLYSNEKFIKLIFFDSGKIVGWSISLY